MRQSSKYEYVLIQMKFSSRKSGSLCLETGLELEPRKTVMLTACSFQHRYLWFSELFPLFWKADILLLSFFMSRIKTVIFLNSVLFKVREVLKRKTYSYFVSPN